MGVALYRVEELRAIERAAAESLAAGTLMARAGRAAATFMAQRHVDAAHSFCIVCGPGNNGGDGFVVAAELRARGHDVRCVLLGTAQPTAADALDAHARWTASGGRVQSRVPFDDRFDVVVDAMFGIGLARPLAGEFLAAAEWMNRQPIVYAIDVPSGLDSDTGAWVGDVPGVCAMATLTFIGDKPGLHTGHGVDAAGDVVVEPIGTHAAASNGHLIGVDDLGTVRLARRRDSHKGTYGNVVVVGGGRGMVGAALLAGRAALRLGAGRVYVDAIGAPEFRVDPACPELMFRPLQELADLQAIVVGCGLGADADARVALDSVLGRDAALVADADALTLLAADADLQRRATERRAPLVLTPHPLEAARLLGTTATAVQADRVAAAQRIAERFRCMAVVKGAGTVVARPDGCYAINPTGSPALATAGTGDVLAGMIAALLAQGHEAWCATQAAVWLHGRGAEGVGDIGLLADEVAGRAVAELRRLRASLRR
jgi:ADP-dependent NAD(P)H-hydrate dehydratase / NAD(P)H-hydrate epimerase